MATYNKKRSFIWSVLHCKCPRCRQGNIFATSNAYHINAFMKMHPQCPVCGQPTELEPGFYYGTGYVSYALAIVICVISFLLWWMVIGFSFNDNRLFWWIGCNAFVLLLLQPYLMRLSRSIWLSFFVEYDTEWEKNISTPKIP